MPKAKEYPGRLVTNIRFGNRRMHRIAKYRKNHMELGIYSDAFDEFAKLLVRRIKRNQQNVIMVEGSTGAGKSTYAILLCYELAKRLKVKFSLQEDYIYTMEDLLRKIKNPNASPINLIDEAVLVMNAKGSMTKQNRDMVDIFNTMRSLGWTTVLVAPSIFQIDKTMRLMHIDYKVHCSSEDDNIIRGYGRGFFEVSKPKRYEYSKDAEPYWVLQVTGVFGKLPPRIDAEYQPIKLKAQRKLIDAIAKRHKVDEDEAGEVTA